MYIDNFNKVSVFNIFNTYYTIEYLNKYKHIDNKAKYCLQKYSHTIEFDLGWPYMKFIFHILIKVFRKWIEWDIGQQNTTS